MRFLTAEELHRLAVEIGDRYRAFVLMAGYLGPRWSELVELRVSDLTLLRRRITISRTLVEVRGSFHLESPKSAKGVRAMTMPAYIADTTAEHIARYPSRDGFVFSAPEGGPIRRSWVRRHLSPAVARAKLSPFRFHDLRHTSAGLAIAVGAHPKVIQERLGHSSIKVTLDTYGHLFPNLDSAIAEGLDRLATRVQDAAPPNRRPRLDALGGRLTS